MVGCNKGCKDEFKGSNFLFSDVKPQSLVTSQWTAKCGCMNVFYVIWRCAAAMGFIAMLILVALGWAGAPEYIWYRYLSNLSFILLTIDTIIQFVLAAYGYSLYRKIGVWDKVFHHIPWYLKLQWLITNIAVCAAFLVAVSYWLFIPEEEQSLHYNTINVHGTNAVYVFLNLFITAMPVRVYHVIYSQLYFALVLGVDAIIQLVLDQPPTYFQINWKEDILSALLYGLALGSVAIPLVIWLIYYAFYRIRCLVFRCLINSEEKEDAGEINYATPPMMTNYPSTSGSAELNGMQSMGNSGFVSTVYVN